MQQGYGEHDRCAEMVLNSSLFLFKFMIVKINFKRESNVPSGGDSTLLWRSDREVVGFEMYVQ